MSDFVKQKIAFAVGLLAVLFTITPLLQPFGSIGYPVFGLDLTLLRLYYFLSILLTLAVYAYSVQFLTERNLRYPAVVGNVLYAVAIVTPAAYVLLFGVLTAVNSAGSLLRYPYLQTFVEHLLSGFAGAVLVRFVFLLQRVIGRKEKSAVAEQLEREEMQFLHRAEQLSGAGHFDLAAVEAWKALEVAARRTFLRRNLPVSPRGNLVRDIEKHRLLPGELISELNRVRQVRNLAAHAVEPISKEQAEGVITATARLLAALAPPDSDNDGTPDAA